MEIEEQWHADDTHRISGVLVVQPSVPGDPYAVFRYGTDDALFPERETALRAARCFVNAWTSESASAAVATQTQCWPTESQPMECGTWKM